MMREKIDAIFFEIWFEFVSLRLSAHSGGAFIGLIDLCAFCVIYIFGPERYALGLGSGSFCCFPIWRQPSTNGLSHGEAVRFAWENAPSKQKRSDGPAVVRSPMLSLPLGMSSFGSVVGFEAWLQNFRIDDRLPQVELRIVFFFGIRPYGVDRLG